jgi:hypothetical protein
MPQAVRSHQPTGWSHYTLLHGLANCWAVNLTPLAAGYTAGTVHWPDHPPGFTAVQAHSTQPRNHMTMGIAPARIALICHTRWNGSLLIIPKFLLSWAWPSHQIKNGTWKELPKVKWNIRKCAQARKVPEALAEGLTLVRVRTFYRPLLLDWARSVVG